MNLIGIVLTTLDITGKQKKVGVAVMFSYFTI